MKAIYDTIGEGYNNTRIADPFLTEQIVDLLKPTAPKLYMDIGCGSGNYTRAIAQMGFNFIGIDPSEKMLEYALDTDSNISWKKAAAESIPLEDESIDGAMATLTLHHWSDIAKGFKEVYRVLKPDSRFVILTSLPSQMDGYWLNHYFPVTMANSKKQMPSNKYLNECAKDSGFSLSESRKYDVKDDLQDKFLYVGKNKPEVYLDPNIRKGISSFSAFANAKDVQMGLEKLKNDIDSDAVYPIIKEYENPHGDYLFMVFEK